MIADRAMRLCGALHGGVIRIYDGGLVRARRSRRSSVAEFVGRHCVASIRCRPGRRHRRPPAPSSPARPCTSPSVEDDPDYEIDGGGADRPGFPQRPGGADAAGRPGDRGGRRVYGGEATPFSQRQVHLLETFADQAVIAIENVRMFKELETRNRELVETLEQQTATSEILRVISSSPTDVQPVFDAIAAAAQAVRRRELGSLPLRRQPDPLRGPPPLDR